MYISYLQLKVARYVLNLGVRDIGSLIQTSRTTISKLENNIIKIGEMRLSDRRNTVLVEFFKKNGVIFPDYNCITFCPFNNIVQRPNSNHSMTRFQLRAARTILNKTQDELADLLNINSSIISYAENLPNEAYINPKNVLLISSLISLFHQYKIYFPTDLSITYKSVDRTL